VAHLGAGEDRIYYRPVTDGSGPWIQTDRGSKRPPAIVVLDGKLWIAHAGAWDNRDYVGRPDVGQWQTLNGQADTEPCLAVYRGCLVYGFVEGRSMRMQWP
jgi:hypothetical protein